MPQDNTQLRGLRGEAYYLFFAGRDPGGNIEPLKTHEIYIEFGTNAANRIKLDLSGFKNAIGQTVADVLDKSWLKIEEMLIEQGRQERLQAEYDRAELEGRN